MPELVPALLLATVALLCVPSVTVLWSTPGGAADPNLRVGVSAVDVPLAVLTVVWLAGLPGRLPTLRRLTPNAALGAFAAGLGLVALLAHPSPRGLEMLARVVGGVAVVDLVRRIDPDARARVAAAVVVVGAAQAALAVAQALAGHALGIGPFELEGPLYRFGTSHAGRGSLTHPYHLAVLLLVAAGVAITRVESSARPVLWLAGLGACAAGIGVTYSRAGALGLTTAVVILAAVGRRRERRLLAVAALAIAVGFGVTALGLGDGWHARYQTSTDTATVDTGRVDSARDALRVIGDHAAFGVGPGRYVVALAGVDHRGLLQPPHDFALHAMAELGLVAGLAVSALAAVAALRRLRAGAVFAAASVLIAPFFLFDAYPYAFPVGLALTALWLALAQPDEPVHPDEPVRSS